MNSVRTEPRISFCPYSTSDSSPALKIMHTYARSNVTSYSYSTQHVHTQTAKNDKLKIIEVKDLQLYIYDRSYIDIIKVKFFIPGRAAPRHLTELGC